MSVKRNQYKARELWFIEQKKADLYNRMLIEQKFGSLREANRLRKLYEELVRRSMEGNYYGG